VGDRVGECCKVVFESVVRFSGLAIRGILVFSTKIPNFVLGDSLVEANRRHYLHESSKV